MTKQQENIEAAELKIKYAEALMKNYEYSEWKAWSEHVIRLSFFIPDNLLSQVRMILKK